MYMLHYTLYIHIHDAYVYVYHLIIKTIEMVSWSIIQTQVFILVGTSTPQVGMDLVSVLTIHNKRQLTNIQHLPLTLTNCTHLHVHVHVHLLYINALKYRTLTTTILLHVHVHVCVSQYKQLNSLKITCK